MVSYNCLADLTQGVDGEKKKKTTGEEFYFVLFFHRFQTTRSPGFFFLQFLHCCSRM